MRSMQSNKEELKVLLSDFNPACVCLQETRIKPTTYGLEGLRPSSCLPGLADVWEGARWGLLVWEEAEAEAEV